MTDEKVGKCVSCGRLSWCDPSKPGEFHEVAGEHRKTGTKPLLRDVSWKPYCAARVPIHNEFDKAMQTGVNQDRAFLDVIETSGCEKWVEYEEGKPPREHRRDVRPVTDVPKTDPPVAAIGPPATANELTHQTPVKAGVPTWLRWAGGIIVAALLTGLVGLGFDLAKEWIKWLWGPPTVNPAPSTISQSTATASTNEQSPDKSAATERPAEPSGK